MTFWNVLYLLFVMAFIIALMYGVLFLLKKYVYSYGKKQGYEGDFEIVSTQTLHNKKFLVSVTYLGKLYLLGVTDNSITLIDIFDEIPDSINSAEQQMIPSPVWEQIRKKMGR